jgi:hypothetical protein
VLRLAEIFTAHLVVTGGGFHAVTCETQDLRPKWRGGNVGGSYTRRILAKFCGARKKGEMGDRLHAVLCAAGYNIRWLLRMIAKKGLRALLALLLRLLRRAKAGAISLRPGMMHSQPALG